MPSAGMASAGQLQSQIATLKQQITSEQQSKDDAQTKAAEQAAKKAAASSANGPAA
jgi:cell division protein FtsL